MQLQTLNDRKVEIEKERIQREKYWPTNNLELKDNTLSFIEAINGRKNIVILIIS